MSLELTNSQYKLEDICLQITDGKHGDCENEENSGYYFVSVKDIDDGVINYSNARQITKFDFEDTDKRTKLENEDILITNSGTIGKFVFVNSPLSRKTTFQKSVAIIKPNKNKIIPKFLYYYLISEKRRLVEYAGGTTQKNLLLRDIRNFEVEIPDETHQKKIIEILNNIDQLITIDKKININLFNIASSLQTDWMINFTPFKSKEFKSSSFGLIPENWNVGKLGDVIELLDSKRIPLSGQKRENMEKIYPYYGAASLMDYVDDYIFDGIYLLMGEDGTVIDEKGFPILQYVWGKFWVNNHAHILKGKNGFNVDSLYLLLSKTNIQSIVTGAVQAKVNQSNLKSIEIIIPPVEVMNEFNELIKPFFDAIRSNHDEIEKLQKLRDTLLPKLMSGEIDVSKINCDMLPTSRKNWDNEFTSAIQNNLIGIMSLHQQFKII